MEDKELTFEDFAMLTIMFLSSPSGELTLDRLVELGNVYPIFSEEVKALNGRTDTKSQV